MVTKQRAELGTGLACLILAKNHMVTKHEKPRRKSTVSLILAKNHMVTKPQIHVTIYLKIIKY